MMPALTLLATTLFLSAQVPASKTDADQLADLLAALSNHSKTPVDLLDPALNPSDRNKSLGRFSAAPYELTLRMEGDPMITGDKASVPVSVHYKAEDGNSLDSSASAQFVRRRGTWYFSNFDFMRWPFILIVVLVVGVSAGIGYASAVLLIGRRLATKGLLGTENQMKMFIPFFWPSLYRQTR